MSRFAYVNGQFVGMATGTTTDIKHPLSGAQIQMPHQEINFLHRPFCERIPQIGATHMTCHWFKPVFSHDRLSTFTTSPRPRLLPTLN